MNELAEKINESLKKKKSPLVIFQKEILHNIKCARSHEKGKWCSLTQWNIKDRLNKNTGLYYIVIFLENHVVLLLVLPMYKQKSPGRRKGHRR